MADSQAGQDKSDADANTEDEKIKKKAVPKRRKAITLKRALITAAGTIGLFIANRVHSGYPLISHWTVYISCIVFLLGIYTFIPQKSWGRKSERLNWKILFAVIVILGLVIMYLAQPVPPPPPQKLALSIKTLLMEPQKTMNTLCWIADVPAKKAAPIPIAMYVSFVNLQSNPSMIVSYSVDVQIGSGTWIKLKHIPIGESSGFKTVCGDFAIDVDFNGFDKADSGKNIQPFEPNFGWLFFDIPNYDAQGKKLKFRFLIRDATGVPTAIFVDPPKVTDETELPGTMSQLRFKEKLDLRDFQKGYFSDLYPQAN